MNDDTVKARRKKQNVMAKQQLIDELHSELQVKAKKLHKKLSEATDYTNM